MPIMNDAIHLFNLYFVGFLALLITGRRFYSSGSTILSVHKSFSVKQKKMAVKRTVGNID